MFSVWSVRRAGPPVELYHSEVPENADHIRKRPVPGKPD